MAREDIKCQNCAFWSFDMDMDPFCTHANASSFGTDTNRMRGAVKTPHMRGEPCGPDAQFFRQGEHKYAQRETNI